MTTCSTLSLSAFTEMAAMVDAVAVNGCLASGLMVIVETDTKGLIAGIHSAFTDVEQAHKVITEMHTAGDYYAIVIPTEHSAYIFYDALSYAELRAIAYATQVD